MGTFPRSRTHVEVICGVSTTFALTAYSNRIMIIVTQLPNMGTLVRACSSQYSRVRQPLLLPVDTCAASNRSTRRLIVLSIQRAAASAPVYCLAGVMTRRLRCAQDILPLAR